MSDAGNKTILLVEDEAVTARVVNKALEKCGYKVIHVDSGEKAFELFENKSEIDLILMDINLGDGIDGPRNRNKDIKRTFSSGSIFIQPC